MKKISIICLSLFCVLFAPSYGHAAGATKFENISFDLFNATIQETVDYGRNYKLHLGMSVSTTVKLEKGPAYGHIASSFPVLPGELLDHFGIDHEEYNNANTNYQKVFESKQGAFIIDEVTLTTQAKQSERKAGLKIASISINFLTMPGIDKMPLRISIAGTVVNDIQDSFDRQYGKHETIKMRGVSVPVPLWESGNKIAHTVSHTHLFMYDKELYKKFIDYITTETN